MNRRLKKTVVASAIVIGAAGALWAVWKTLKKRRLQQSVLATALVMCAAGAGWAARAKLLDVRPLLYHESSHATSAATALTALDHTTNRSLFGDRNIYTLMRQLNRRMRQPDGNWNVAAGLKAWARDYHKPLTVAFGDSVAGHPETAFPWARVTQSLDDQMPVIVTVAVPAFGPAPKGTPAPRNGPAVSVLAIGYMPGQPRMIVLIPWEMPATDLRRLEFSGAFRRDPEDRRLGYLLYTPPVGTVTVTLLELGGH